jgi:hypothetical protein
LALFGVALWLATGWAHRAQPNDFTEYWAAGHLLQRGQNPYAQEPLLAMEKTAGLDVPTSLAMRNPPWALPLMLPFAALPYAVAQGLWLVLGLASVLMSVHLLWPFYASGELPGWLAWSVTAAFLPVATVLAIGQIGPLILLGIAGFMDSEERHRDLLAGACALLIAIKPHLAFLFWPALLFWTVQQKRWRILLGLAAAGFIFNAIPLALDWNVFSQYLEYWRRAGITAELMPTPSVLRLFFGTQRHWVEFLPALTAAIWFLFHWRKTYDHWNWPQQLPLLLIISVTTTPLVWFFDQIVLLPCMLQAAAWVFRRGNSRVWPVVSFLGMNSLTLLLLLTHRTTYWYSWTASAWLIWYLWMRYSRCPEASTN